jgi:hypothetical protein
MGLVTAAWGFGLPPLSLLAHWPPLIRLNYYYIWPIPGLSFCIFFAYGAGTIIYWPRSTINNSLRIITAAYTLFAIWTGVLVIDSVGLGDIKGLVSLFLVGLTFAVLAPLTLLAIAKKLAPTDLPTTVLIGLVILCFAANVVAVYSAANINHVLYTATIALVVVCTWFNAVRFNWLSPDRLRRAVLPLVVATIGAVSVLCNWAFPALPPRHDMHETPPFMDTLGDRLNWRAYGVGGVGALNNFVVNHIAGMNNQNAAVPGTLRTFLQHYSDAGQYAQGFLGLTGYPAPSPLDELRRNRRMWDYLGVRFLLSGLYFGPEQSQAESELFGYGLSVPHPGAYEQLTQDVAGDSVPLDCHMGRIVALQVVVTTFGRDTGGVLGPGHFQGWRRNLRNAS